MVSEEVDMDFILAIVPPMALFIVSLFPPIEKSPEVNVKLPFIIKSPSILIPVKRFTVKLFNVEIYEGRTNVTGSESLKIKLDVLPATREP